MELIIKERNQIDNIEFNYAELKKELSDSLVKYKGIIYDDSAIKSAKKERASLNNLIKAIEDKRKEIKKECLKPYEDFETKIKEMLAMIEKPILEIDTQIKTYEEKVRTQKKLEVERLIKEVIVEQELNEKYGLKLDVSKEYCNASSKEKDIKDDLTSRAMTLKVEQDREEELIDIIKDAIESENERINRKIKFEDFKRFIDRGMSTKDVIAEIKLSANRIYEAENPPIIEEPEPIIEPIQEVVPEPISEPIKESIQVFVQAPIQIPIIQVIEEETEVYFAVYRIVGKLEQLRSVSKFLKDNGIDYSVTDQGEI